MLLPYSHPLALAAWKAGDPAAATRASTLDALIHTIGIDVAVLRVALYAENDCSPWEGVALDPASTRARDPRRKERVLVAAAELIARNGYLGVNMTDIGAAVGITGSGIYRHFKSKAAILLALFDTVVDRLIADAEQVARTVQDPRTVLECLVRDHISFTISERQLCLVYLQESRNLPPADLRHLRWKQRHYVDLWQDALLSIRDDISAEHGQVVVHACIAGIHSVLRYEPALDDQELRASLERVALDTLGLGPSSTAVSPVGAQSAVVGGGG